jgi:hypothetical protein
MPKTNDSLVSVTIKFGAKFFEGKKHSTHKEMAALLEEQATNHNALSGVFMLLAGYHHRLEAGPHGVGEGGDSATFDIGAHCVEGGKQGCWVSVNGGKPTCYVGC